MAGQGVVGRVRNKVKSRKMRDTQGKINRESELWERQTQGGRRQQKRNRT